MFITGSSSSLQQWHTNWAITLVDCDGYDSRKRPQDSKLKVFKGSLVRETKQSVRSSPQLVNYCDITNPAVWCPLHRNDVLPISEHQKELLLGVEDCVTRYEMINRLKWIDGLRVGLEVFVLMPDQTYCKSVVHYIGNVEGAVGIRFGLELLVR